MERYYAHSRNDAGTGVAETVRNHVLRVTRLAREFAAAFGMEQQAEVAGLLHDLGKYSEQFQRRITVRGEPSRDHWSIGALAVVSYFGSAAMHAALAIEAHHVGLNAIADAQEFKNDVQRRFLDSATKEKFTTVNGNKVWKLFQADAYAIPARDCLNEIGSTDQKTAAEMLDVRMLFSALVDADFLATEGHFAGDATQPYRPRSEGLPLDVRAVIRAFDDFVTKLRQTAPLTPMQPVRETLAAACLTAADSPTGAYTLSAPTGSGKTLAMLAFALHHARKHGLRRIVLVLPFLNILEQTAKIYRDIFADDKLFGPHFILEDHSLADNPPDRLEVNQDEQRPIDQRRRLLAQNWDAPIILTTNVQLLESLHARKPSRCRKLHRLAKSIILFDEVQTLPPKLAKITLATLSRLSDPNGPYGSTVVFATATQPAFSRLHAEVAKLSAGGWQPPELVPNPEELFALARGRVNVAWRHDEPMSSDQLVDQIAEQDRVLCIVNLKRHAMELVNALNDRRVQGVMHLSTNLCPAHRSKVLEQVKARLNEKSSPVRLIATQCVEAGVDISFPVVMRSLGPLEAIAQAAGRCNRSGEGPTGEVIVYRWPTDPGERTAKPYPPGYEAAVSATTLFLREQNLADDILHAPERIRTYYELLYALDGRADGDAPDERAISLALTESSFIKVDEEYRLIENDTLSVIVPHDRVEFDRLQAEAKSPLKGDALRDWFRRARPLTVSIYRKPQTSPVWSFLDPIRFGEQPDDRHAEPDTAWFWLLNPDHYDDTLGLTFPADAADALIV